MFATDVTEGKTKGITDDSCPVLKFGWHQNLGCLINLSLSLIT